jgi:hypothetical protein
MKMVRFSMTALASVTLCFAVGRIEQGSKVGTVYAAQSADGTGQAAESAGGWVKFSGNPVLGGEKVGHCYDVAVLRENGKYRMWFSWTSKRSIALVESTDGIHWGDPVVVFSPLEGSTWEGSVNRPTIVKRPDGYHMWYSGLTWDDVTSGRAWIGYATSPDGIHWTRASKDPVLSGDEQWEDNAVMNANVLWDDTGKIYKMWYSAGGAFEPVAFGYATSPDGIHWTKSKANPIFGPDPHNFWEKDRVGGEQVFTDGGWYYMFYIGYTNIDHAQIGIARSRDGVSDWERHPDNPIIRVNPDPKAVDHAAAYKPFVLWDADANTWLLWYNGRNERFEQICLATHKGKDLGF